jgi:DNA-binding NtrC family response regulator
MSTTASQPERRRSKPFVLVVGGYPDSWKNAKRALAGQCAVAYAIDLAGTRELLARGNPTALLIYSDLLDATIDESLDTLATHHPELKIIVIGGGRKRDMRGGVHLGEDVSPSALLAAIQESSTEGADASDLKQQECALPAYREMVLGKSPVMRKAIEMIRRVARTDVSVLLSGESGTGKELFARRLHCLSRRARGPFRALNLPAIPGELFESVLFGHERGSFTGAVDKSVGAFEQASGGTLFLDEVASTDYALQAKLLRAIQEGEIERVGGRSQIKCDTRIVAASNVDLEEAVSRQEFREDLYHRLSVIVIEIPPLRRRVEDIPLLVDAFLRRYAKEFEIPVPELGSETMEVLQRQEWSGNVRQLENSVQRALLLNHKPTLRPEDFLGERRAKSAAWGINFGSCEHSLQHIEHAYIEQVLERHEGNQSKAAQVLGIDRKTLRTKRQRATGSQAPAETRLHSV